jgi:protein O-GlcNAc transferase
MSGATMSTLRRHQLKRPTPLPSIRNYNRAQMQLFPTRPLLRCIAFATIVPLAHAQTNSTVAASSQTSTTDRVKEAEEAFRSGSAAYLQNDLLSAHIQFAKVVKLAPEVAAGHTAFGTVLLAEGDLPYAADQLELAHKLDPQNSDATLHLAITYSQLREYQKSAQLFQLLSDTKSDALQALTPAASIAYAASLAATGQPAIAQKNLEAALNNSPDNAALHDSLGIVLAQQQTYSDATVQFQRAISLEPSLASAHYHLGSVFLNQDNLPDAVSELSKANDLSRENVEYAVQLGRALRANDQEEKAITVLRHALFVDPASTDVKYELALTLQANDNPREAIPLFQQVAAARPQDSAALTNLGLALVQTGDAKGAIVFYLRALALDGKNSTLRQDLGVAYLQQSDLNHAIEQFRAGLLVEPDNSHLHYDLGLALKLKDDPSAAVAEFVRAEQLDPKLPDPHYTLGVLYMQLGRFAESQVELENTTVLRPDNGEAWALLGNVYKNNNDPEKAAAALRRAIDLLPNQPSPHISLAAILSQQGDAEGAAAERKKAASLSRIAVSRQRANFALDSGKALLKQGQIAEAIAQLQSAVDADPNYSEPHSVLADALDRQGRGADAALERQKARKLLANTSSPGEVPSARP